MMLVVKLGSPDDVQDVFNIRAQSLRESPESFGKSLEEYQNYSFDKLKEMLKNVTESSYTFLAYKDNYPLGIIGYHINGQRTKLKHQAELNSLFVIKSQRRAGVATLLLDYLLDHARQKKIIQSIVLGVNIDNKPAISLYQKHGFVTWGRQPDALYVQNSYYDLQHMYLRLN